MDSGGVLGSLMARKLINTAGRKQVIGRPILYKTTKDFLVRFGLKDLNELPSIEEFEKMSAEFAEAIQEEIPMSSHDAGRHYEEEDPANTHESQADGEPYSEENLNEGPPSPLFPTMSPTRLLHTTAASPGSPPNYAVEDAPLDEAADSPALDAEGPVSGSATAAL